MNKQEWDHCFIWLASLFPNWKVTSLTSAAWYGEMMKFSQEQFKGAVRRFMARSPSPHPPGIFEIKGVIFERDTDTPDEAWETVLTLCRRGAQSLPEGTSKAVEKAVKACGGLAQIGYTELDKLTWLRKEFVSCYNHALKYEQEKLVEIGGIDMNQLPDKVRGLVASIK